MSVWFPHLSDVMRQHIHHYRAQGLCFSAKCNPLIEGRVKVQVTNVHKDKNLKEKKKKVCLSSFLKMICLQRLFNLMFNPSLPNPSLFSGFLWSPLSPTTCVPYGRKKPLHLPGALTAHECLHMCVQGSSILDQSFWYLGNFPENKQTSKNK